MAGCMPATATAATAAGAPLPPATQAVDEDQEGDRVEWRKVFEEDREFNQGGWARGVRRMIMCAPDGCC